VKAYSTTTLKLQNITEADGAATGNALDKHQGGMLVMEVDSDTAAGDSGLKHSSW